MIVTAEINIISVVLLMGKLLHFAEPLFALLHKVMSKQSNYYYHSLSSKTNKLK